MRAAIEKLVKTANKLYPKEQLRETKVFQGEWVSVLGAVNGVLG